MAQRRRSELSDVIIFQIRQIPTDDHLLLLVTPSNYATISIIMSRNQYIGLLAR